MFDRAALTKRSTSSDMRSNVLSPQPSSRPVPAISMKRPVWNFADTALFPLQSNKAAQSTLAVGPINDSFEREADRMSGQTSGYTASTTPLFFRTNGATTEAAAQRKAIASSKQPIGPTAAIRRGLNSPGQPLDRATRAALEPRFGVDFSAVRIHSNAEAATSARNIHAHAYTSGNDIVFGESQYRPFTSDGQRLLAHELTHVVQQSMGATQSVQRKVTFDGCDGLEKEVTHSHDHATSMSMKTVAALVAYDGTRPSSVHDALETHFHSTSKWVANIVAMNLLLTTHDAEDVQYECHKEQDEGTTLAQSMWCVPFSDIQLFKRFFGASEDLRGNTLIHEWIHRYACKFDLGYEGESSYKNASTTRALANADPYGNLAQALGT